VLADGDKRFLTKFDANNDVEFDVRNLGEATSPRARGKKGGPDTFYEITPRDVILEGEFVLFVAWRARIYHGEWWTIAFDYR
jgi:hypothetical protein